MLQYPKDALAGAIIGRGFCDLFLKYTHMVRGFALPGFLLNAIYSAY
jgi:hypothetical protein